MNSQNGRSAPVPARVSPEMMRLSALDAALQTVLTQLKTWNDLLGNAGGLPAELFSALTQLFEQIRQGASPRDVEGHVNIVVRTLSEWFTVFDAPPFNNPSAEELVQLGQTFLLSQQKLAENTQQLMGLQAEVEKMRAERVELQQLQQSTVPRQQFEELQLQHSTLTEKMQALSGDRVSVDAAVLEAEIQAILAPALDRVGPLEKKMARLLEAFQPVQRLGGQLTSDLAEIHRLPARFIAELKSAQSGAATIPTTAGIDGELARCKSWLEEAGDYIAELTSERDDLREQLEDLKAQEKRLETQRLHDRLNACLRECLEQEQRVKDRYTHLRRYKEACEIMSHGWSSEETFTLPTLSSVSADERAQLVASEERSVIEEEKAAGPWSNRRHQLEHLAQSFGLRANAMLMTTLYEILPETFPGRRPHRGMFTVAQAAERAGLLRAFDWNKTDSLLKQWRQGEADPVNAYLRYAGKVVRSRGGLFIRKDVPLPWKVTDLLTEAEIEAFQGFIKEESAKK